MAPLIGLLFSVLPHVPDVIRAVESIFDGTKGQSETKLETAINLLIVIAPDLAKAFGLSPEARETLAKVITIAVAAMNASGTMRLRAPVEERSVTP